METDQRPFCYKVHGKDTIDFYIDGKYWSCLPIIEGTTYDFSFEEYKDKEIFVGGKAHQTTSEGWLGSDENISGKKILIAKVVEGSPSQSSTIFYKTIS